MQVHDQYKPKRWFQDKAQETAMAERNWRRRAARRGPLVEENANSKGARRNEKPRDARRLASGSYDLMPMQLKSCTMSTATNPSTSLYSTTTSESEELLSSKAASIMATSRPDTDLSSSSSSSPGTR